MVCLMNDSESRVPSVIAKISVGGVGILVANFEFVHLFIGLHLDPFVILSLMCLIWLTGLASFCNELIFLLCSSLSFFGYGPENICPSAFQRAYFIFVHVAIQPRPVRCSNQKQCSLCGMPVTTGPIRMCFVLLILNFHC